MAGDVAGDLAGDTGPHARLSAAREQCLAQISALTREHDRVVEASTASNADDEHDPEGATIAFERAQVDALLQAASARLADVEAALARVADGGYGRCLGCGRTIDTERLLARPATTWCIDCARLRAPRRR